MKPGKAVKKAMEADRAFDKKVGIKPESKADKIVDKQVKKTVLARGK